jgi:hypothetical protein
MDSPRIADLFFTTDLFHPDPLSVIDAIVSAGIRFATHGTYSHAMIISGVDPLTVISADAGGVSERAPETREMESYSILTLKPEFDIPDETRQKIVTVCRGMVGKDYAFEELPAYLLNLSIQMKRKLICSWVPWRGYTQNGIYLVERIMEGFVVPEVLYTSPMLQVVKQVAPKGESEGGTPEGAVYAALPLLLVAYCVMWPFLKIRNLFTHQKED